MQVSKLDVSSCLPLKNSVHVPLHLKHSVFPFGTNHYYTKALNKIKQLQLQQIAQRKIKHYENTPI